MAKPKTRDRTAPARRSPTKGKQLLDGVTSEDLVRRFRETKEPPTERVDLRVTKREKLMIERLKEQSGMSVTKLLITLAAIASERMGLSEPDA
jgi:hypothetical protein